MCKTENYLERVIDEHSPIGFDYDFHAMQDDTNELFSAYKEMFDISASQTRLIRTLISTYFSWVTVLFVRLLSFGVSLILIFMLAR